MKKIKLIFVFLTALFLFSTCVTNPLTGQRTMALVSNNQLFPMAFAQYQEFLNENTVVTGTPEALMLQRVGERIADAAQKWLAAEGFPNYLDDYQWEFTLIQDNSINAWVMPGGKIVFYTGILPVTQNEAGIAVVMGHEIAHAVLNHGQQRMSAGVLQQIGAVGVSLATLNQSPESQALILTAFGAGSTLFGTLPFSRTHEIEADKYGAVLMAIAGYNPEEAIAFWDRISSLGGGGVPEFLSTHPSDATRKRHLRNNIPEAKRVAARFGVTSFN